MFVFVPVKGDEHLTQSHRTPLGQSVDEFAADIGVCRGTVYNELAAGNLQSIKVRGRRIITARQRDAYIKAREAEAGEGATT